MADKKISALTASSTPLAGTEVLPIVQSSATVKVAVSDLTAGRAISAASLTLTTPLAVANGGTGVTTSTGTGNTVLSAAPIFSSGIGVGGATAGSGGIAFPATAVAVTDANTLDDYEESTWTPTLAFGGNSVSITYTSGYNTSSVTKIGSRVFVSGITILTSKGSSSGNASLKSLPYPPSGVPGFSAGACSLSNTTFTGQYAIEVDANDAVVYFYQVSALGAQSNLTNTNFANNSAFTFSFSYYTSA